MNNVFTVEELFAARVFVVPDYQRGYAWEGQQLREFVEDLEALAPGKDHYTGTVVLNAREADGPAPADEDGKRYAVAEVVDGQQRLTTVVIALDAVRREMAALPQLGRLAAGIRRAYIAPADPAGQPLYKLVLNRDCRDYFVRCVLSDTPGPDGAEIQSHRRLTAAREFFAGYLGEHRARLGERYEGWLRELREKIVHHLKVTLYTVEDRAEVGVIFEVLNNRGKPLSELEKVKNYLLFLAAKLSVRNDLAGDVNGAWTDVFERLMRADLTSPGDEDQLLRSHWLMAYDHLQRHWEGSRSVKERFNLRAEPYRDNHAALLADLRGYVGSLHGASLAFCEAYRPRHDDSFAAWRADPLLREQVKRAGEKLVRVNVVAPFLPLLVACRLRFPADGRKYLDLTQLCERFAFRVYRWVGYRSNAGQSYLLRLGRQLYGGNDPPGGELGFDEAMARLRGHLLWYCSNEDFRGELVPDEKESDWYDWYGLKYFLYEYEEHLAKGEDVRIKWEQVERLDREKTIEHVLPQTPTHDYWKTRFDASARRRWTHDIGNLCLTSDNSSYGNKPFPDKKGVTGSGRPGYANSNLYSERALAAFAEWDEAAIQARRRAIGEWAVQRWHVDDEAAVEPDESDEAGDAE